MEGSYTPNYVQIEYGMLCNSNDTSYNVFRNFENSLFTYIHSIITNGTIIGGIKHKVMRFSKSKKRWLESLQVQERETHVGKCSKIRNTTLISRIYLLNIKIFIKNKHLFYTNKRIHSIHTRFKTNLYPPTAKLTRFQKGLYYSTIKIFNNLPQEIKDIANDILPFRNALKRFLLANSFHNSKEYFNYRTLSIEIYMDMWGHPQCNSPSSVQFSARQHDNTLSLPLSNPSLSVNRLHSQLQTKCSFPSQHFNTSIYSTSHTYLICQLTNGRTGRPREDCIKMATFPAWGHSTPASTRRHIKKD